MIIIGEKINGTRKSVARAILERDADAIRKQIEEQDNAGAHYIDLNAGVGRNDDNKELEDMNWLIDTALGCTEKKISIDSSNSYVIEKSAVYLEGKRDWLLNSIKDDSQVTEKLLPLVKEYSIPVIALAMDKNGIPETAEERLAVCEHICETADKYGIEKSSLLFDPLVMPLSANHAYSRTTLDTLDMIKNRLPEAKTVVGTSNVSYGLPARKEINRAFLIAAVSRGLDYTICDPVLDSIKQGLVLGKLIAGKDKFCRSYTRAERKGMFKS
jgi:cobalamin-dependent methionine synthase I